MTDPNINIRKENVGIVVRGDFVSDANRFPVDAAVAIAPGSEVFLTGPSAISDVDDDITVDGTAGGVLLLAANPLRISAVIQNTGSAIMRVTDDGSAPTPTHGYQIWPGGSYRTSIPGCVVADIRAIRESSTSTTASVSEQEQSP